jgi:hypothetical protein
VIYRAVAATSLPPELWQALSNARLDGAVALLTPQRHHVD